MQTQQSAVQTGQRAGVEQQALDIQLALTQVLRKEADAILSIVDHFPENAWQLVDLILATRGKIVFSGLGKSGLVAQKLAATSSSLGIASFFLHPSDALHGDLGSVQKGDLFIALSKSATGAIEQYWFTIGH